MKIIGTVKSFNNGDVVIKRATSRIGIKREEFIVFAWDSSSEDYLEVLPEGKYSNFTTFEQAFTFAQTLKG